MSDANVILILEHLEVRLYTGITDRIEDREKGAFMDSMNFSDLLNASNVAMISGATLNPFLIGLNILVAAIVGVFIASVYRRYFVGVLFQNSFAISIVVATIVTTLVIMVISGNLILSLGMVGALSIVRFRAAIKDPLDVVYLFWAIGSGIAIGVAQYTVVILASIFIAIVLHFIRGMSGKAKPSLLVISSTAGATSDIEAEVMRILKKVTLRSKTKTSVGVELVYEVVIHEDTDSLLNSVISLDPSAEIRVLNYHGNS